MYSSQAGRLGNVRSAPPSLDESEAPFNSTGRLHRPGDAAAGGASRLEVCCCQKSAAFEKGMLIVCTAESEVLSSKRRRLHAA